MKKLLKIFGIIIIILIVLPLVLFAVLHFISHDIDEVTDSDLIITVEIPDDTQNAYFDLVQTEELIVIDNDLSQIIDYLKGENTIEFNDDDVQNLLDENQETINLFEDAVQKPVYQNPVWKDINDLNWDSYSFESNPQVTQLGRIIAIKALYEFKHGNDTDAINICLDLAKLGQIMEDSEDLYVQKLVAKAIKNMAFETMNYMLSEGDYDKGQLTSFKEKIENYKDSSEGINDGYKVNYMLSKNTVDLLVREGQGSFFLNILAKNHFYFKPNETKQMLADNARFLIENSKTEESQIVSLNGFVNFLTTDNSIGKMIFLSLRQYPSSDQADSEYEKLNNLIELKLSEAEESEVISVPVKRR